MKYGSISSVLVLALKANSCLSPSHPFRMDYSSCPSCVWFWFGLVGFFLCVCVSQLHSFLCFLLCGDMKEGSQWSIAVSKSFKMVRCPSCVSEGHRILYECLPYWHFSNHKMVSCCDTLNSLSSLILLCFFHYVV